MLLLELGVACAITDGHTLILVLYQVLDLRIEELNRMKLKRNLVENNFITTNWTWSTRNYCGVNNLSLLAFLLVLLYLGQTNQLVVCVKSLVGL